MDRSLCLVFVETVGNTRKRFIGTASPGQVRRALARRYIWLESAGASAYCASIGPFVFDPATGSLSETQMTQLMQQFLGTVRQPAPVPVNPADAGEWVMLPNGTPEHAKWLDGERIERLLGDDLTASYVVLLPNKTVNVLVDFVLGQQGRFIGVVDVDRSFRCLVDRLAVLESLSRQFWEAVQVKEVRTSKSSETS